MTKIIQSDLQVKEVEVWRMELWLWIDSHAMEGSGRVHTIDVINKLLDKVKIVDLWEELDAASEQGTDCGDLDVCDPSSVPPLDNPVSGTRRPRPSIADKVQEYAGP